MYSKDWRLAGYSMEDYECIRSRGQTTNTLVSTTLTEHRFIFHEFSRSDLCQLGSHTPQLRPLAD